MIKAGDKVILDDIEYVIKEIKGNDVLLVKRDDALNIMFMNEKTLYAKLYEQQKQRADELESLLYTYRENTKSIPALIEQIQVSNKRADELEKRWEKLKEHFVKEKEKSFGILSWSRNNGELELMERLEENNNA